jgi:hypothetical protein
MRVTGTSMAIPRPVFLFSSFLDCVGINLVGGFNHLEKYESQWEGLFHILWTNKIHV